MALFRRPRVTILAISISRGVSSRASSRVLTSRRSSVSKARAADVRSIQALARMHFPEALHEESGRHLLQHHAGHVLARGLEQLLVIELSDEQDGPGWHLAGLELLQDLQAVLARHV